MVFSIVLFECVFKGCDYVHDFASYSHLLVVIIQVRVGLPLLKSYFSVSFLIFLLVVKIFDYILALFTFFFIAQGEEISLSHYLGSQDFIQLEIQRKNVQSFPLKLQNLSYHFTSATLLSLQTPGSISRGQFRMNQSFSLVSLILKCFSDQTLQMTLSIISKSDEVTFLGSLDFPSCLNKSGTLLLLKQVLEKALRFPKAARIFPSQSSRPTFLSIGLQLVSSGVPLKILKQESSVLNAFFAWRAPLQISVLKLLKNRISPTLILSVKSYFRLLQRQTCVGSLDEVLSMIFSFWVKSRLASYLKTFEQSTMRPIELWRWIAFSFPVAVSFQTSFLSCCRVRICLSLLMNLTIQLQEI